MAFIVFQQEHTDRKPACNTFHWLPQGVFWLKLTVCFASHEDASRCQNKFSTIPIYRNQIIWLTLMHSHTNFKFIERVSVYHLIDVSNEQWNNKLMVCVVEFRETLKLETGLLLQSPSNKHSNESLMNGGEFAFRKSNRQNNRWISFANTKSAICFH